MLKESPQKQLEKYVELAWKKLSLEEKLSALRAIEATGSGQAMKLWGKVNVNESNEETYFPTYSAALNYLRTQVEKKYDINEDDWFDQLASGGKPRPNQTKEAVGIDIYNKRTGKTPGKKRLQVQIYNRGTNNKPFELNWYIL